MIISHKHKYLFIGLPFSASSAISKELYLKHEGQPLLRKHSLYHEFKAIATEEEKKYFVFAVLRNPMDIVSTVYEKMKANEKGNFTNPKHFKENGGHITKKHRRRFRFIHKNKATFQQYFKKFYRQPYDNLASLTISDCDYIIRYENLAQDYSTALKKVGIKNAPKLPLANKTKGKNKNIQAYYTNDIKQRAVFVFGPFMQKYNYCFPQKWGDIKVPYLSTLQFKILMATRKFNQIFCKKNSGKRSESGTIYGDIQRDRLKNSN